MEEVKTKLEAILELRNFNQLKNSIELFSRWRDELTLRLSNEGLRIREMDDSHVALLELELPREEFEKFEVEGPINVTVEVDKFLNALRRTSDKNGLLRIEVTDEEVRLLYPHSMRRSEIPRLNLAAEEPPVLKFSLPARVELDVRTLQLMLRDVASRKQGGRKRVKIAVGDSNIAFRSEEEYGGCHEMCLRAGDPNVFEISNSGDSLDEVRSTFSLEYLKRVVSNRWRRVRFHLGDERPLILEYSVGRLGRLRVYLAHIVVCD
jgi:proliferating cell nuclear antigen